MPYSLRVVFQRVPVPRQQYPLPKRYVRQSQPWHMRYSSQVTFPQPRVALPHMHHMRYQLHVALPRPRVAFPQAQHSHMWY